MREANLEVLKKQTKYDNRYEMEKSQYEMQVNMQREMDKLGASGQKNVMNFSGLNASMPAMNTMLPSFGQTRMTEPCNS